MSDKNVFEKAIDVLREKGWHQGALEGPDGSLCAVGALSAVTSSYLYAVSAENFLRKSLDLPPNDPEDHKLRPVPAWNDDPHTTYEDVVLAFKHAASTWDGD